MEEPRATTTAGARALAPTRRAVAIAMLGFAFLLPFLTWQEAAGGALLALLSNVFLLPELEAEKGGGACPSAARGGALYAISILALVLVFRHSLAVVAAAWAILALGASAASFARERSWAAGVPPADERRGDGRGASGRWPNREPTWPAFAAFIIAGTAGAYTLLRWVAPALSTDKTFYVSLAAATVGALVETAPIRLDPNLTVPLAVGAFTFCALLVERSALDSNLPYLAVRILLAVSVNAVLALAALALEMVTESGAAAGFLLGVAVYLGYGWKSFLILFAFFALGALATRAGYAQKAARGVAEGRGGARSWREALANTLAGAFFSILVITTHREAAFLAALTAAFAEAAGDTVSSEIGQWLSERAYRITTLQAVPAGENGGISLEGSVAGALASALVAGLGLGLRLCRPRAAAMAFAAAVAGNLLDSVLGATLERRGLLSNGAVNFIATCFAGALALAFLLR